MSWPEDGQAEGVNSLLLSLYVLFGTSLDWIRPTHTGEAICFTQPTNSNGYLSQKHPHGHIQNHV